MNLYPFQVEAVEKTVRFLRERNCVYNASDMGTGKSAVTLAALKAFDNPKTKLVLIVCPAVVKLVWEAEIRKWAHSTKCEYHIYSYDKAAKESCLNYLLRFEWDFLIADESHYVKNPKAKRTKAVLKLWDRAKYKICLSGTPFTQSIMDCHSLFSRMAPEDFSDYWEFAKTYTNIKRIPWGPKYKFEGVKNHEKLKKIIKEKFFFRYTKEEVLKDLPNQVWQKIPLGKEYATPVTEVDGKLHEKYLELLKQSFARQLPPPLPPTAVATLVREQGVKKVPAVAAFARNLLDSGTPIIIFCTHSEPLNKLAELLKDFNPVCIEGKTSEAKRKEAVEAFQAGLSNCIILNMKAGGTGLTLTRSSVVILAELSYSPSDISQSVARAHRIGTKSSVNVYWFCVQGFVDERIAEVVTSKAQTFNKVLNGP